MSQTFHDSFSPEMLPNICVRHIDHPQYNPLVYHGRPEQTACVAVENDEEKIQQLAMTGLTMSALRHRQTMHETDAQTSSTCFLVSADANQMIEFVDEIQSNQQQLHLGPCCKQKYSKSTTETHFLN